VTIPNSPTDNAHQQDTIRPGLVPLLALIVIVLVFRAAAFLSPSRYIVIPDSLALPLSLLGVVFLMCGVWAWRSNPSNLTRVFLIYGLGGCIHWGGSIGAGSAGLEVAFLFLYLAVTALGDAAFLDLALRYPRDQSRFGRRTLALYLLAILTLVLVPVAPFLAGQVVQSAVGLIIGIAFLMSTVGGLVFLVKWFRATGADRRAFYLTPIVVALVVSSVLDLMADQGLLPGDPEAWNLPYAIVPVTLAWALIRLRSQMGKATSIQHPTGVFGSMQP